MKPGKTFFLLLLFFSFACKRENCRHPDTTITGSVIDAKTNQPIADAEVTLERVKCKGFDFSGCDPSYIKIKSTKTDGNGNFTISFCKDKDRTYSLSFLKEGYNGWSYIKVDDFITKYGSIVALNPK